MFKKRGVQKEYKGFLGQRKLLIAVTTLVGTIIGAGVLGIPYVVAKAGFLYGLGLIVGMGILFLYLNLFVGEIVLRTKEQHQLTGYAGKYLGPVGKKIMMLSMLISLYGALTAYLIGEGHTLFSIFKVGSPIIYTLIFFAVSSYIICRGVKATGRTELVLISLLLLIIIAIGIYSFNDISISNFTSFNPAYIFLPYGVILFALLGAPAIPEIQEELGNKKALMKKAIIIGSILPIIIYVVFTVIMVGLIGLNNFEILEPNQRIATVALSIYSLPLLGLLANILAMLAMFTSYLTLGIALFEMYHYDYNISRRWALFLTFSLPLVISLLNLTTFITVLGVTGAFAGGLEGTLIILSFWKAKKLGNRKPEYSMPKHTLLGGFIILVLVVGIIQQVWKQLI